MKEHVDNNTVDNNANTNNEEVANKRKEAEQFMDSIESRDIVKKNETRNLITNLSDERLIQLGEELSTLVLDIDRIKQDKKRANDNFNSKIKEKEARELSISESLELGTELSPVTCEWEIDYTNAIARLRRTDTDEYIEERTLTLEETQTRLFDEESNTNHKIDNEDEDEDEELKPEEMTPEELEDFNKEVANEKWCGVKDGRKHIYATIRHIEAFWGVDRYEEGDIFPWMFLNNHDSSVVVMFQETKIKSKKYRLYIKNEESTTGEDKYIEIPHDDNLFPENTIPEFKELENNSKTLFSSETTFPTTTTVDSTEMKSFNYTHQLAEHGYRTKFFVFFNKENGEYTIKNGKAEFADYLFGIDIVGFYNSADIVQAALLYIQGRIDSIDFTDTDIVKKGLLDSYESSRKTISEYIAKTIVDIEEMKNDSTETDVTT